MHNPLTGKTRHRAFISLVLDDGKIIIIMLDKNKL